MPEILAGRRGAPPSFARPAGLLLYGLLLASAAATLASLPALDRAIRLGRRPAAVLMVAPWLLVLFVVLFGAYRFALVRAGRYHAGKAFVQVGFMVLVAGLVVRESMERYRVAGMGRPVDLTRQLGSEDPEARAMAAELARHRPGSDALRYVPRLVALLDDPSSEVRRQARASLVSMAGRDAGGEGSGAPERWRAYWRARGVAVP